VVYDHSGYINHTCCTLDLLEIEETMKDMYFEEAREALRLAERLGLQIPEVQTLQSINRNVRDATEDMKPYWKSKGRHMIERIKARA